MAAPDFYFAINATFRFFYERWGEEGLTRYWEALGREYFAPLSRHFREGGLAAVEEYWRDFFAAEPGGEVTVRRDGEQVTLEVRVCPAIRHLRAHGREVMPLYCRHCDVVSGTIAREAGLRFGREGGDGACRQWFAPAGEGEARR
ncbi:MAG: hypothetical protein GX774_09510 [Armatimonadetes bacterium]|jgi:hypothetical protein|nr:hypothetical protein [Armatimonadota bacterium]